MKRFFVSLTLLSAAAGLQGFAQNRACQLLTSDEVKSATGIAFENPEAATTPQGGTFVCAFASAKGERFSIAIHEKAGKSIFETNKAKLSAQGRAAVTTVSGLGDDAFAVTRGPMSQVSVLKGDRVMALALIGPQGALSKVEELARKAVARF